MNSKTSYRYIVTAIAALLVLAFSAVVTTNVFARSDSPEFERSHTEQEFYGKLTAVSDDALTIGTMTVNLSAATEIKDILKVGDAIKVHLTRQADGTWLAREVEKETELKAGLDDNGVHLEPGDDNGNHVEPGDDKGNHPEPSDDNDGGHKRGRGK